MALLRDIAICLRVVPFSETSQVVTLLTREHGRLKLIAKGARRQTKAGKGRFDGGLDVLDRGDALFSYAPEKELGLLAEWKLIDGHRNLRGDLRAVWLGQYAAEVVDRLLEEHDAHPRLFDGMARLLQRLAEPDVREAVALAFLLNVLRQAGLLPDFSRCREASVDGRLVPLSRAVAEERAIGFDTEESRLMCGEAGASPDELHRARPSLTPVPRAAIVAIVQLLGLSRGGGGLPTIDRPAADAAHRLLVVHIRHQTDARLRLARFVLGDQ